MQGFGVLLLVLRYSGYAQGLKRGLQELTASEEAGRQSYNRKELGSTCHLHELGSGFSLEPPDEASSLADTLILAF